MVGQQEVREQLHVGDLLIHGSRDELQNNHTPRNRGDKGDHPGIVQ